MFGIVLNTPLGNLPKWTPQNQLLWTAWARALVFFFINRYLKHNALHGLGVPTPNMKLPKNHFWKLNLPIDFSQLDLYAELEAWFRAPGFEIVANELSWVQKLSRTLVLPKPRSHERIFKKSTFIFFMIQKHFLCIAYDWVLQKYRQVQSMQRRLMVKWNWR